MKKYAALLAATAAVAPACPAFATTNFTGSANVVSIHNSDPGLVVYANPINFGPISLDAGQSAAFNALTIGTDESYVETCLFSTCDTTPFNIEIGFAFSAPGDAMGGTITGKTRGIFQLFGDGFGRVTWDGPVMFDYGNGGSFSVALDNVNFDTEGSAIVTGKISLLAEPVPEPATWAMMIAGFGVIGMAMRRRLNVALSFA